MKHSRAAFPRSVQEIYSLHPAGPASYDPSSLLRATAHPGKPSPSAFPTNNGQMPARDAAGIKD